MFSQIHMHVSLHQNVLQSWSSESPLPIPTALLDNDVVLHQHHCCFQGDNLQWCSLWSTVSYVLIITGVDSLQLSLISSNSTTSSMYTILEDNFTDCVFRKLSLLLLQRIVEKKYCVVDGWSNYLTMDQLYLFTNNKLPSKGGASRHVGKPL